MRDRGGKATALQHSSARTLDAEGAARGWTLRGQNAAKGGCKQY